MSVAAIGSSDAYDRYRQQQLSLATSSALASSSGSTTAQSFDPVPLQADPTAENSYASKFKADLSALNGKHHHAHHAAPTGAPPSAGTSADSSNSANSNPSQDGFNQAMDQLVGLLNVAVKVATVVI